MTPTEKGRVWQQSAYVSQPFCLACVLLPQERELLAQVTELRSQNARLEQQLQVGSRSSVEAQEQVRC